MRHVLAALTLIPALAGPMSADLLAADPLATDPLIAGPPAEPSAEEDIGFRGCGSHAAVARWLSGNFAEAPMVRGIQGDGQLFEIYVAKQGETWTVVVTSPAGESCIVTEGTSMEVLTPGGAGPVA